VVLNLTHEKLFLHCTPPPHTLVKVAVYRICLRKQSQLDLMLADFTALGEGRSSAPSSSDGGGLALW
jgi:hypothetical protein